MAGILHGSVRTTARVRAELQALQDKTGVLVRRYGLSRATVSKWQARRTTADAPIGPRDPRSTVLTADEEAVVVEFWRRTTPPLEEGVMQDAESGKGYIGYYDGGAFGIPATSAISLALAVIIIRKG